MKNIFEINQHKNRNDYSLEFDRIAKEILNSYILKTPENEYKIKEIEFYYFLNNYHMDYYCHKDMRQKLNSQLYFHRFKYPEKYRNKRQKGIDLTFGLNNSFGGILIRLLQNIKTQKYITGIGNITNQILEDINGAETITKIYEQNENVFSDNSIIKLIKSENEKSNIYKKQRIGLNLKKLDTDMFFLNAKYNYFTYPIIEKVK